jgi:hypothetical protein
LSLLICATSFAKVSSYSSGTVKTRWASLTFRFATYIVVTCWFGHRGKNLAISSPEQVKAFLHDIAPYAYTMIIAITVQALLAGSFACEVAADCPLLSGILQQSGHPVNCAACSSHFHHDDGHQHHALAIILCLVAAVPLLVFLFDIYWCPCWHRQQGQVVLAFPTKISNLTRTFFVP